MERRNCVGFLESFVSDFFNTFCQPVSPPNVLAMQVLMIQCGYFTDNVNPLNVNRHKVTCSGSAVEFYLNLPLSCVEDIDLMVMEPGRVAIPGGCAKIRNRYDDEIYRLVPVENHPGFVQLFVGVSEQTFWDNRVKRSVQTLSNGTESSPWLQFE